MRSGEPTNRGTLLLVGNLDFKLLMNCAIIANEWECVIENYHTIVKGTTDGNFRYYTTYEFANSISNLNLNLNLNLKVG